MRDVCVSAVANGWIVTVGCQRFVYDEVAKLVADFQSYLTDPDGTEKRIMATAINAKHTMGAPTLTVGGTYRLNGSSSDSIAETRTPYYNFNPSSQG